MRKIFHIARFHHRCCTPRRQVATEPIICYLQVIVKVMQYFFCVPQSLFNFCRQSAGCVTIPYFHVFDQRGEVEACFSFGKHHVLAKDSNHLTVRRQ